MATGPEHYREAEALIGHAEKAEDRGADDVAALNLRYAQVHATLALAAATAISRTDDMPVHDGDEWLRKAGWNPA
ncbi:MAG: hypothetical protein J2P25_04805 [Nocardiopsaceae bacterium]|nr:hypothetical protein [Nocardiopsaceae bacterium]